MLTLWAHELVALLCQLDKKGSAMKPKPGHSPCRIIKAPISQLARQVAPWVNELIGEGALRCKSGLLCTRHLQAYLRPDWQRLQLFTPSPQTNSNIAPLCGHEIHANVRHPFHYYSVIIVCDVWGINYWLLSLALQYSCNCQARFICVNAWSGAPCWYNWPDYV